MEYHCAIRFLPKCLLYSRRYIQIKTIEKGITKRKKATASEVIQRGSATEYESTRILSPLTQELGDGHNIGLGQWDTTVTLSELTRPKIDMIPVRIPIAQSEISAL